MHIRSVTSDLLLSLTRHQPQKVGRHFISVVFTCWIGLGEKIHGIQISGALAPGRKLSREPASRDQGQLWKEDAKPERSFSGLMSPLTLISLHEKRWRWWEDPTGETGPTLGADYLISSSNWPESCSFSSAQLGYLNLISVYKSIRGFVFILVCWECWRKRESLIHNSPKMTDGGDEAASSETRRSLLCVIHGKIKRNPSTVKRAAEK